MKFSFIGMSGAGKSYWAEKLSSKYGLKLYICDGMIEDRLAPILSNYGYKGVNDMGRWMGQPTDSDYYEKAKKYLELEKEIMNIIIREISDPDMNCVIDTTGSVIYTGESTMRMLKNMTKIVNFDINENVKNKMYELYMNEPKPVIWGDVYEVTRANDRTASLGQAYHKLLNSRITQYHKYADINLDYGTLRRDDFTIKDLYNMIKG